MRKLECVTPTPVRHGRGATVWGWLVGWVGRLVAGRPSFPGSSSLERWLGIRLPCTDMGEGWRVWAPATLVIRYWHHQERVVKLTEKQREELWGFWRRVLWKPRRFPDMGGVF